MGDVLGRDPIHQGPLLGGADRPDPEARRSTPAARRRRLRRSLIGAFAVGLAGLLGLNASLHPSGGEAPASAAVSTLGRAVDALRGPPRIGLQVGHLDASAMPPELEGLRASTGAQEGGLEEVQVNRAIVAALAVRLRAEGFRVDVLDATVPVRYRADLVLAVHADANPDASREGYKSAHFLPARNRRAALLKLDVDRAVLAETGLGDDDRNVSIDMRRYYAFNDRRFRHAVARRTPALIVEMGYLTSVRDRALLERPDRAAKALSDGVNRYLRDVGRISQRAPGRGAGRSGSEGPGAARGARADAVLRPAAT